MGEDRVEGKEARERWWWPDVGQWLWSGDRWPRLVNRG